MGSGTAPSGAVEEITLNYHKMWMYGSYYGFSFMIT